MQDKYHTYENFYLKCTNLKDISEYLISFHNHTWVLITNWNTCTINVLVDEM